MPGIAHSAISRTDQGAADAWLRFTCGHCGTLVSGVAFATYSAASGVQVRWLLCTGCGLGSVANGATISPGTHFGPSIDGLPTDVAAAYAEARSCMSVSAFTAAELLCRKLLMHVAVEKGATEGQPFAAYLSYLESLGHVTPPMKPWVNLIREHGNASTHELAAPDRNRAESTVMLTAELLRLIYEMEAMAAKYGVKRP